jgi:nucleoside phosphorylase
MLDTEHGIPEERSAADSNNYYLGSIGGHNVAIACLPLGSPGTSSAATVAMHMQRTFTGIRIGLLVGVGGGAPSAADDIRLGDVVVSTPNSSCGGVIEYVYEAASTSAAADNDRHRRNDDGSSSRQGRFLQRRCLNKPPPMLLTALSSLQSEHDLYGSKAGELLEQAAARYPKIQPKLVAPSGGGDVDIGGDRLYQASYVHAGRDGEGCDGCDARMLVRRPGRSFAGPAVHFGIIASGEREIACGITRNQAKADLGVLCFEREAAGLMDNFPCLVVRGISDYADTHKSPSWRGYAAGTAAAFAKELLQIMPPRGVEQSPTIIGLMNDGEIDAIKNMLYHNLLICSSARWLERRRKDSVRCQRSQQCSQEKYDWLCLTLPVLFGYLGV